MVGRSRRLFWRDLVRSRKRETVRNGHELVLSPGIRVVVKALPEWSQTPLNLAHVNVHTSSKGGEHAHTCSCRTVGLLKSSGPVYVPSVTKNAPSTPSSLMLRSRSCALSTRSFSSLRASRSALVSRRGSSAGSRSVLPPMPRKDRSGLLPRPFLALYSPTPLPDLSCDDPLGPEVPAVEVAATCALDRRTWPPREGGCDSLPWLLPIVMWVGGARR